MGMHPQPNAIPQPQHLRRESSQSAHSDMSNANMSRGYSSNGSRGRGGFPQQPHYQNMPAQSPQMYNARPHQQHMGRGGMPPAFQPQSAMQQNSPFRGNRSPAITPATMHQQQQYANGPYYQPQQGYPQPVRIPPPPLSTVSSVSETSQAAQTSTAPQAPRKFPHSVLSRSADMTALDLRVPLGKLDAFSQTFDSPFLSTVPLDHNLTQLHFQTMYGMPPQMYDPSMYGSGYGLQQSIHYPGGMPASPGRVHGFPQQMPGPYGGPGYQPQAQGMSRTPSNMSERPSSAVPQQSTPVMTNVSHIAHTPSVTAASPAPISNFIERPKKGSKAIQIKARKYNSYFSWRLILTFS